MKQRQATTIFRAALIGGCSLGLAAQTAQALNVPFTEHFASNSANWRDASGTAVVGWSSNGGPDGSGYATTSFNFSTSGPGSTPAVFRNQEEFNSSGLAFQGDWVAGDVRQFGAYVRHNAGMNLNFFVRFADPANFPGAAAVISTPVPSGQWTHISVPMIASRFVFEGPFGFNDVFDNLGHIQIGVVTPPALENANVTVGFDLDQPMIVNSVPAISEWGVVAMSLSMLTAATIVLRKPQAVLPNARGGCGG